MKTIIKLVLLGISLMLCTAYPAICDGPGPPTPPPSHGAGGNQDPQGAPIDGGLGILVSMAVAYGCKKYLQSKKEQDDPASEFIE